ncbi:tail fiber assembly protein [Morganella psychrotolerans]|uniref:Tail fiber assembly protein n=1 Tax=Morganella psychrotolerans TaxID=368603 RepID=A0A1B8HTT9_9GAMM|nr:tail fiber assembly protein [Morganella psychrotolerans]OBU13297.1 hypothetical protein AYY18_00680 [Morganella psychrotolerans]
MKYYKDKNDVVYALNPDEDPIAWIDVKVIEISENGADILLRPQPTKEQLIEQAEAQKQYLIAEVQTETQMLQTKLALGRIKDDEKARLNAWLDYLDELEAVDVSTAPDIIWPVKPVA